MQGNFPLVSAQIRYSHLHSGPRPPDVSLWHLAVWILKMSVDWALWIQYRILCDGYTCIFFSFVEKAPKFSSDSQKDAWSNKAGETLVTLSLLPPTRKPYVRTPNLHFHFFCSSQLMQVFVVIWIRVLPINSYIRILALMEWQYLRRIRRCGLVGGSI